MKATITLQSTNIAMENEWKWSICRRFAYICLFKMVMFNNDVRLPEGNHHYSHSCHSFPKGIIYTACGHLPVRFTPKIDDSPQSGGPSAGTKFRSNRTKSWHGEVATPPPKPNLLLQCQRQTQKVMLAGDPLQPIGPMKAVVEMRMIYHTWVISVIGRYIIYIVSW